LLRAATHLTKIDDALRKTVLKLGKAVAKLSCRLYAKKIFIYLL